MLLTGISIAGWIHSIACLIALVAGAYVLIARKGTSTHRRWGWWYAGSIILLNLTVMLVFHFDILPAKPPLVGPHIFGIFHWMAVATLASVLLAVFAASRQKRLLWAHVHAQAMLFSYYMLVGGLFNEMVVRIAPLRRLAFFLSPHAGNPAATAMARLGQTGCMMIWLTMVVWFAIKVSRDRTNVAPPIGYPMRLSGALFLAGIGGGILVGALTGLMGYGVIVGAVAGIIAARRSAVHVRPRWGCPSLPQLRAMVIAIGLEMTLFSLLGASGYLAHAPRQVMWEITLGIVGLHFLIMRWSHGPMMVILAVAVLGWLGLGYALRFPLPLMAAGDGLIKLGIGLVMAWPLLRPTGQVAREYRQA